MLSRRHVAVALAISLGIAASGAALEEERGLEVPAPVYRSRPDDCTGRSCMGRGRRAASMRHSQLVTEDSFEADSETGPQEADGPTATSQGYWSSMLQQAAKDPSVLRHGVQLIVLLALAVVIPSSIFYQLAYFDADAHKHGAAAVVQRRRSGRSGGCAQSALERLSLRSSGSSSSSGSGAADDETCFGAELSHLLSAVLVASLCAFCMGYHTAVVSVVAPHPRNHAVLFPVGLTSPLTSIALIGAFMGAAHGILADTVGRRRGLLAAASLCAMGAIIMATAQNLPVLYIGSGLSGIGAGLSSCLANVYIAEVALPEMRGELAALAPLASMAGVFIASSTSSIFGGMDGGAWRLQLGILLIPALAVLLLQRHLPETPRWLMASGRRAEAQDSLHRLFPSASVNAIEAELELLAISAHAASGDGDKGGWRFFLRHRYAFSIAFTIGILPHICGIHVQYYGTTVLQLAGFGEQGAQVTNLLISCGQVLCVLLAAFLVDRVGRRSLAVVGTTVMLVGIGFLMIGFASLAGFSLHSHANLAHPIVPGVLTVLGLVLFRLAFALSLSPLPYIVTAELFGQSARATGAAIGSAAGWGTSLLLCQTYPVMKQALVEHMGSASATTMLFGTHFLCTAAALVFIAEMLPETMHVRLEAVDDKT